MTTSPLAGLLRPLAAAGLDLDAEAVLDAVWLALRAGGAPGARPADTGTDARPSPGDRELPADEADAEAGGQGAAGDGSPPAAARRELVASAGTAASVPARSVRLPLVPALPDGRAVARAVRPLRRKVPSSELGDVDVTTTVLRAADEDIWLPVLRRRPERWLDLALVVDYTPSMAVWGDAVRELQCVLRWSGAFRRIARWWLRTDGGAPRLYGSVRDAESGERGRRPAALTPVARRGLVLVVTDCVADAWYDGTAPAVMRSWARAAPVALASVLPRHFWGRTALRQTLPVRLRAPTDAATNAHLLWAADLPLLLPDDEGIAAVSPPLAVPVVTLEPESIGQLARMVAGTATDWTPGVLFDEELRKRIEVLRADERAPAREVPPQERVRRFFSVASAPAKRLAAALAASPVLTLRVLRLLRQELLPHGWQLHEAEVLLSGLFKLGPRASVSPQDGDVALELLPEVRPLLLDNVTTGDALRALRRAAEFAAGELADARAFHVLLDDPEARAGELDPKRGAFSQSAAEVLERVGGAYARLVRRAEPQPSTEAAAAPQGGEGAPGSGARPPDTAEIPPEPTQEEIPDPASPGSGLPLGREKEALALQEWWRSTNAPPVLEITGPPGIGKTWLAQWFVRWLTTDAGLDSQAVFSSSLRDLPPYGDLRMEIARFFIGQEPSSDWTEVDFWQRFRIALRDGRHLVVLDDAETMPGAPGERRAELVFRIIEEITESSDTRVLLLGRDRAWAPPVSERWQQLRLGPLDPEEAIRLLRSSGAHGSDQELARLADRAGGHPYLLALIGDILNRSGEQAGAMRAPLQELLERSEPQDLDRVARLLQDFAAETGDRSQVSSYADELAERAEEAEDQGRLDEAVKLHEERVRTSQELGRRELEVDALMDLAQIHVLRDDEDRARELLEQAATLAPTIEDPVSRAVALRKLGSALSKRGENERARAVLIQALQLFRERALEVEEAETEGNLADLAMREDRLEEALALRESQLRTYARMQDMAAQADTFGEIALIRQAGGDFGAALQAHEQELALTERLGNSAMSAVALSNIAEILATIGDIEGSIERRQRQAKLWLDLGKSDGAARAFAAAARLTARADRADIAHEFYARAIEAWRAAGAEEEARALEAEQALEAERALEAEPIDLGLASESSTAPMVLITASRRDETWRGRLEERLTPLAARGQLRLGPRIEATSSGELSRAQLERVVSEAAVAILLVSPSFLSDGFLIRYAVPALRERAKLGRMRVIPVLVEPAAWEKVPWLRDLAILPPGPRPLSQLPRPAQAGEIGGIANAVLQVIEEIGRVAEPAVRREESVSPARGPTRVSINLPTDDRPIIEGLQALTVLEDAWNDRAANVIAIIGPPHAGKTTLVREWLHRMAEDGYRGAAQVFAWSFRSRLMGLLDREPEARFARFLSSAWEQFGRGERARRSGRGRLEEEVDALVRAIRADRTALVLDAMDRLKHLIIPSEARNLGSRAEANRAVQILLASLARENPGLCVITTTREIPVLDQFDANVVRRIYLEPTGRSSRRPASEME